MTPAETPQPTACPGRHGPCWLASMPQWAVDEEFADLTEHAATGDTQAAAEHAISTEQTRQRMLRSIRRPRRCAECNHPCTNPNAPAGYCSWLCRGYADRHDG